MKNIHVFTLLLLLSVNLGCSEKKSTPNIAPPVATQAIIYKLNVRDFTSDGTFKAMLARLPELKSLGVNTLVFAPIHPIGKKNRQGMLGSVYASSDFKGIHPDLGTKNDFHELIDSCHALGLYVILEWEATHTAADHPWVNTNPQWYKSDSLYFPAKAEAAIGILEMQDSTLLDELAQSMAYWVDTFAIDGYFASSANDYPMNWWSTTLSLLKKFKPLLLLANSSNKALLEAGFDLLADAHLYDQLPDLFQKPMTRKTGQLVLSTPETHYHFISQHTTGRLDTLAAQRYGNRKAAMLAFLMSSILPGAPLLVAGEEVGHAVPLKSNEKNTILWSSNPDILTFYSTLLKLRTTNEALNGDKLQTDSLSNPKLLLVRRGAGLQTVYGLINPTDSLATMQIPLGLQGKRFTDIYTGRSVLLEKELLLLEYSFYLLTEDATS